MSGLEARALPAVAVTGVTGTVGRLTADALADAGVPFRMVARSPERAPHYPGSSVVAASYGDAEAARAALEGVETLFMVSAAEDAERLAQHRSFVDAAADAGVRHIVYTSFFGASPTATFTLARDHAATEGFVRETGIAHTFLRDNLYLDFTENMVGDDDVIRGPADSGRAAMVARADVARVAAVVLQHPHEHRDVTYDLTGPEELTFAEVAETLSRHFGRPISFHDETIDEAYASRRRWEAPPWQYDAWVSTYTAVAAGELAGVTDHVERVTGRRPLSLGEYLRGKEARRG
ncbi:NAD(P)H-binding protein [Leifsonia sp. F6_8S_P_1B]|uniref:NAD(P)H-binding protein n=1 Tax=Leifsonia williamsii TaxID=3035919 RepID=A0ABT8K8H3_9MICO|nr:NAD(P)H-binding protein [Leifsonia williamsii]MDN4613288.1 NAD(P)H-binding protein [Leifsonia williamsii]